MLLSRFLSLSVGERLWVSTPIAVLLSTLLILAILRADSRPEQRTARKFAMAAAPIAMAALLTAILYVEALFVLGYLGFYRGPAHIVWMIGIPASAAFVACRGNLLRGAMLFPVVLVLGYVTMALISISTGLPLD